MPIGKSTPMNAWLAAPPEGKTRIIASPTGLVVTHLRNFEDARWVSSVPAAGIFRQVAPCKSGAVLYGGPPEEIQDRTVAEISRRHMGAPARLGGLLAAYSHVLKIVAIEHEACVEEVVSAAPEHVRTLMVASSNPGLLSKVQDELDGVVTGLLVAHADEEEGVRGLQELLREARETAFVIAPSYLASRAALRDRQQRLIVHANNQEAIRAAIHDTRIEAVITNRREYALDVLEGPEQ